MIALAELTRPGPFAASTVELGGYLGVRREGRLVAMAGRRLHLPGWIEISAVCTHPDHRGQGLSRLLMAGVETAIRRAGTPSVSCTCCTRTPVPSSFIAGWASPRAPT